MDDPLVPQKNPQVPPIKNPVATIGGRAPSHLESGGNAYQGLQSENRVPVPEKAADLNISNLHKDQPIPTLRTFESDAAEAVQKENISVVSIAAKKIQKPSFGISASTGETKEKNRFFGIFTKIGMTIGALILIIVSIGILGYVYLKIRPKVVPAASPITSSNNLAATDDSKTVTVASGETTLTAFLDAQKLLSTENATLVQINFVPAGTTTPLDSQEFLSGLGAKTIPPWFIRAMNPQYTAGYYHDGSNWDPFILLSVASYDNAFAGMLQWESGIASDLASFYQIPAAPAQASTSTSTPVTLYSTPSFTDIFVDNKNVRAFAAPGQNPLLIYSFPSQNILILTTTENALKEIFSRLASTQFVR